MQSDKVFILFNQIQQFYFNFYLLVYINLLSCYPYIKHEQKRTPCIFYIRSLNPFEFYLKLKDYLYFIKQIIKFPTINSFLNYLYFATSIILKDQLALYLDYQILISSYFTVLSWLGFSPIDLNGLLIDTYLIQCDTHGS